MSLILQTLQQKSVHRQVLAIALPMVLSNITVPLLGLVDAAVIGYLEHAWYLGGVALGSTMIGVTFWLLGFLRMSTTGLSAQAHGAQNPHQLGQVLLQSSVIALGLAALFLLVHRPIAELIFQFSTASLPVKTQAANYFYLRAWSAPAALLNLVLLGWLLGTQNARVPMWMVIIINLTNIAFDLLLVLGLDLKVEGVAMASVIADYTGLMFGLMFVIRYWRQQQLPAPLSLLTTLGAQLSRLATLNRDIFLRSLCLQAVFSFMTFQGAALGDQTVAANAVLMSLLMIISYGMDGFAYAMEAMVGKAIGGKDNQQLRASMIGSTFWALLICALLSLLFFSLGTQIIQLITNIPSVQITAATYLPWLVAMPLISVWCFLLDGVFIGATKGREMRNSMAIAAVSFFALYWLSADLGNHALWFAMLSFMALRAITLGITLYRQWRTGTWLWQ
ncbi:MAG: MATE family efflux transporter DinF [Vibrio sp.]